MASRDELFEVPPAEFTQARNALVKKLRAAGKDDEAEGVAALRKPGAPLWVANQLARVAPRGVEALIEAAQRLRRAHGKGAGDELREAMRAQHDALQAIARAAEAAAQRIGARATLDLLRRVQETAQAAAVSAPEALRSGTLEQELTAAGFDALAGTALAPPRPSPKGAPTRSEPDRKQARREEQRLRRELREAETAARELHERAAKAEEQARRTQQAAEAAKAKAVEADRAARDAEENVRAIRARL